MKLRRLDPEKDDTLYREAFNWDANAPAWYQSADKVWRPESFAEYLKLAQADDQADIGIFAPDFTGLVTVSLRGKGVYEGHLSAKRGTSPEILSDTVAQIRHKLFEMGMTMAFVWVASKNRAVKKICEQSGFYDTFVTMLKGEYHGRVIEWQMLATTRAEWEAEQKLAA